MPLSKRLKAGAVSLALLGVASAAACATGLPADAAAVSPACAAAEDRVAALNLRDADRASIEQSIRWTNRTPAEARTLVESKALDGACATAVTGFVMGVGALESGDSFAIRSNNLTRPQKPAQPLVEPDQVDGAPPVLPGAQFVMAAYVGGRRDGDRVTSNYLGLWQRGLESVVATFSRTDGRAAGKVEPLFRSSLPLTSIAYFPSVDTETGRIGLVQQVDAGVVRLIGFDWDHTGAFSPGR